MSILKGLLENEDLLIGLGLMSEGAKGKGIGEAGINSVLQAAKIKKAFAPTLKKTKGALNTLTGSTQFATEAEIQASNGTLIPIPSKANNTNITLKNDKESKFQETVGKGEGEFVNTVKADGDKAMEQNTSLELLSEVSQEITTGLGGTTLLDIAKLGERFGIDTNWLSTYDKGEGLKGTIANAEVLQILSSSFTLDAISKTKGSISDKEMTFFMSLAPSLSMSEEGINNVIEINTAINDRKILKAQAIEEWTSDGTMPGSKKMVDGKMQTFNQMWNGYVNAKGENGELLNPLFSKEEKAKMFDLSKKVDLADGAKIEIKNGKKYYELPNGNWMWIGYE
tara:strand:+ start:693 stop:1709 length:1017 start_codon:yes stop_codon:yes gene_type:complete